MPGYGPGQTMRLLTRLVVTISVVVILGLAAIFGAGTVILTNQFRDAESRQVDTGMTGLRDSVEQELDGLGSSAAALGQIVLTLFASPTAQSNDTTNQSTDSTRALSLALFAAHRLDAIFFIAPADAPDGVFGTGARVTAIAIDPLTGNMTEVPVHLNITVGSLTVPQFPLIGGPWGLIDSAGETWMLGGAPLSLSGLPATFFPGGASLPDVALVTARKLDANELAAVAASTGRSLVLEKPTRAERNWGEETHIDRAGRDELTARIALQGLDGRPAGILASEQGRPIFSEGMDAIIYFFVASLVISAVLLAAGLVFLYFGVVSPIHRLDGRMRDLRLGRPNTSDGVHRDDEVGDLAREFEALLARLEERQRQVTQSNEDLSRYASVVNHDLKSPLSTLRISLGALKTRMQDRLGPDDHKTIARLEAGMLGMAERIDAVLAYSKTRAAQATMTTVALPEVLDKVRNDLAADIARSDARIEVSGLGPVHGDATQLGLLFQNLIANALKFNKPGKPPTVRVTTLRSNATHVEVQVADDGVGFDSAAAQDLFKPFARLDNAKGIDGHGIGLATCARIAEIHGGSIRAESEPGAGARFIVSLPLHAPAGGTVGALKPGR